MLQLTATELYEVGYSTPWASAEIFAGGGGKQFFDKISVNQRFYSISLTLFKILPLKTDVIYDDHACMKTAAHSTKKKKKKQQSRHLPTNAALIGIAIVECYSCIMYTLFGKKSLIAYANLTASLLRRNRKREKNSDCFHICTISAALNVVLPVRGTISQTQQQSIKQTRPKSIVDLMQNTKQANRIIACYNLTGKC